MKDVQRSSTEEGLYNDPGPSIYHRIFELQVSFPKGLSAKAGHKKTPCPLSLPRFGDISRAVVVNYRTRLRRTKYMFTLRCQDLAFS